MNLLSYIGIGVFVVFFFGLCIFVHELGHFLVARWRKMHVVAFSIGFVKAYGWTRGGIEYRIGWLPFGGYVDLPQIDATGQPREIEGKALLPPAKPVDRILTAVAGPVCNIIFGLLLGSFLWWHGIPQDTPKMSEIVVTGLDQSSPEFTAGLRDGDRIVKVNGKSFYKTWNDMVREVIFTVGDVELEVMRGGASQTIGYRPATNRAKLHGEDVAYPFFMPELPLTVQVRPGSPAAAAGMRNGDEIIAVNGSNLTRHGDLAGILAEADGSPIAFTVLRDGQALDIPEVTPARTATPEQYLLGLVQSETLRATVARIGESAAMTDVKALQPGDRIMRVNGQELTTVEEFEDILRNDQATTISLAVERRDRGETRLLELATTAGSPRTPGAFPVKVEYRYGNPIRIAHVMPRYPAAAAGLRAGDQLLKVNGQDVDDYSLLSRTVQAARGAPVSLTVMRGDEVVTFADLVPQVRRQYDLGLDWVITNHPTPWRQLVDTVDMSYKSLRGIFANLLFGSSTLKPKHLSGPLGIVRAIGITVRQGGIIPALSLVVMITFSLALLNLLPFPVLDGGHIVMALYEMAFGKPLPAKLIQPLVSVFVVLLISLMLYVTVFDVRRMIPPSVSREYWLQPATEADTVL